MGIRLSTPLGCVNWESQYRQITQWDETCQSPHSSADPSLPKPDHTLAGTGCGCPVLCAKTPVVDSFYSVKPRLLLCNQKP